MITRLLLGLGLALLGMAQTFQNVPVTIFPTIQFTPTSLTFPSTVVGASSAVQTVVALNADDSFNHSITISLTGSDAGDFSETDDCAAANPLNGGNGQCTVSVTFTPTATGARTANVQALITWPVSGNLYTAALTGTGS
jgi:hypothetical protein